MLTFKIIHLGVEGSAEDLYNEYSQEYSKSKTLPFRWVESFNFMNLFQSHVNGDMKLIVDLACGDGFYTRKLKKSLPTAHFVGVDISEKMIELAQKLTQAEGINFLHHDASKLAEESFQSNLVNATGMAAKADLVCCAYFLNYARSAEELVQYLQSVGSILSSGGQFIGVNDNPRDDISWYNQKRIKDTLGMDKSLMNHQAGEERYEGQEIVYSCYNPDGSFMDIINYWIPPSKIEEAFAIAGFIDFEWIDLSPLPDMEGLDGNMKRDLDLFSKDFKPIVCFKATKASS
jgi:SAM-dependent methyltransferase